MQYIFKWWDNIAYLDKRPHLGKTKSLDHQSLGRCDVWQTMSPFGSRTKIPPVMAAAINDRCRGSAAAAAAAAAVDLLMLKV